MTFANLFRAAIAVSFAGLLAACGGNDVAPSSNAGWGSPAAFVPAGASSKSFSASSCSMTSMNYSGPLYNASLVIASNGDISVQAATTSTAAAVTQYSLPYAQTSFSSWNISGTVEEPSIYMSAYQSGTSTYKQFNLGSGVEGGGFGMYTESGYVSCNGLATVTLQISPDAARAAKNLGTGAGVNTFDDYYADGFIDGGNAYWDNGFGYGAPNRSALRFNLATGALSSATSTSATFTPISLALPTAASNDYGSYGESLIRNQEEFNNQDAKQICLYYESSAYESEFALSAISYGNKFRPYSSGGMMPFGLSKPRETQQGIRLGFYCGGGG